LGKPLFGQSTFGTQSLGLGVLLGVLGVLGVSSSDHFVQS
jgi:hypothetical protein